MVIDTINKLFAMEEQETPMENVELSEKSEGKFELIVKQSTRSSQRIRVGDPLTLGIDLLKGVVSSIGEVLGVDRDV